MNNLNSFLESSLRKILWLWLPFVAFFRLTKELIAKLK